MNEDYVSLEAAKLLKEKGFDWPCQAFYNSDGTHMVSPVHTTNDEMAGSDIACPTLYMAHKWLRGTRDIYITICGCANCFYPILYYRKKTGISPVELKYPRTLKVWNTYEEALQDGILITLEHI